MLGACGAAVAALHRERIGGLLLADYPELASLATCAAYLTPKFNA